MDKKDWLNSGFYLALILIISFCMNLTSNLLYQFGIALIGAVIGNQVHKAFIKPKL
ncbi:hypothetical protein [Vagococcus carniphilus]|uniref:hypothetical protein n=1 Tax=Vagococcus carniphilus TaxID=218144 RepID=UPI00163C58CF|nr:hypothetical protein [Vagococcus carniphilus]QNN72537.1 hypothetical protein H9L18_11835 [Vagococcus carniphilus]